MEFKILSWRYCPSFWIGSILSFSMLYTVSHLPSLQCAAIKIWWWTGRNSLTITRCVWWGSDSKIKYKSLCNGLSLLIYLLKTEAIKTKAIASSPALPFPGFELLSVQVWDSVRRWLWDSLNGFAGNWWFSGLTRSNHNHKLTQQHCWIVPKMKCRPFAMQAVCRRDGRQTE